MRAYKREEAWELDLRFWKTKEKKRFLPLKIRVTREAQPLFPIHQSTRPRQIPAHQSHRDAVGKSTTRLGPVGTAVSTLLLNVPVRLSRSTRCHAGPERKCGYVVSCAREGEVDQGS